METQPSMNENMKKQRNKYTFKECQYSRRMPRNALVWIQVTSMHHMPHRWAYSNWVGKEPQSLAVNQCFVGYMNAPTQRMEPQWNWLKLKNIWTVFGCVKKKFAFEIYHPDRPSSRHQKINIYWASCQINGTFQDQWKHHSLFMTFQSWKMSDKIFRAF